MMSRILIVIAIFLATAGVGQCETWVVQTLVNVDQQDHETFQSMTFSFDNTHLTLNTSYLRTWVANTLNTTTYSLTLIPSGNWAVCGSVSNGVLTPDPYATFVPSGNGGYVHWVPGAPSGYQAHLLLGAAFAGNAAATYDWTLSHYNDVLQSGSVTATLIRDYRTDGFWAYQCSADVAPISHDFVVNSPVPEPSSILALLCGIGGLGGVMWRSRRD